MKKKPKKIRVSVTKNRNMVLYVEDSTMKARVFKTSKEAVKFVKNFCIDLDNGYWVDLLVTDIKGKIKSLDSIEVNEA